MNSPSRTLVHDLLASHVLIGPDAIDDADSLDALGLDALDLVLVVLRIESLCGGEDSFPLTDLANARTVGHFVALVDRWLQRDAPADAATRPARSSAA